MKIRWFGHACFWIETSNGTVVVTDPFDSSVGYKLPNVRADIVTISHDHFDHNYTQAVKGSPQIVNKPGVQTVKNIVFRGIESFHDTSRGSQRGRNYIFCFKADGITVCHLGDLGHELSPAQVNEIGKVDILLIPVGGFYTIGPKEATNVVASLKPKIVIPMHYKTQVINFPIKGVDDFLQGKSRISRPDGLVYEVTEDTLPADTTYLVLNFEEESSAGQN